MALERKEYSSVLTEEPEVDYDDSGSEVTVLLVDDEEMTLIAAQRREKLQSVWRAVAWFRWLFDLALVIGIVVLLAQRGQQRDGEREQELTGDITGFAPEFSQEIKSFEFNQSYLPKKLADFFSHQTRRNWLDLVPLGLGFVKIENPENYHDLPVPLQEYTKQGDTVFTTSITHQLQCLHSIIEYYAGKESGLGVRHSPWQLEQCFEYLRQSIMCCGDVALEGAETTFPIGAKGGSDGWDATHVCKNYNQVYEYLEKHRQNDNEWI